MTLRRLPPPAKLLLAALAATALSFPFASLQWRQDLEQDLAIGAMSLLVGGIVLFAGAVVLALRRLVEVTETRRLAAPGALAALALALVQQVAFVWLLTTTIFGRSSLGILAEPGYAGPWEDPALQRGFILGKIVVLALEVVSVVILGRLLLVAAGAWRDWETHRAQFQRFRERRGVTPGMLLGLLALTCLLPLPFVGVSESLVNLAFETFVYMTLALGLNVIVGYAGLLVLGYAAFWAIGGYTFAILTLRLDWSMWACLPLSGLAAMAAGILVGLPSLRLRGDYLAIVTLGFGEVVYYFLKTETELTGGEMGLPLTGSLQTHTGLWTPFGTVDRLVEKQHYFWPALALLVLAVIVIRGVERSRVGRALMAMREDETAARCMGINTTRLKLSAFAFAAMWAGFAGVLWVAKQDYTNPMYFNFMQSVLILAMVVLGGMGSIPGVMAGAVLIYAGPALLRQEFPELQKFRLLIFGALMVLLMVYRPQGLFGSRRLKGELEGEEEQA